ERERDQADRQKYPKRAEDGDHLQQDQEERRAVMEQPDLRVALAMQRLNRLKRDAVASLEEGEGGRRGCGAAVRQEVEELEQVLPPGGAKSGRQVGNLPVGEIAGDPIEERVAR